MSTIHDRARGRWVEILTTEFGVDARILDGKHHPCPACGGTDRFRFNTRKIDDGVYFCQGQAGSGMDLVMHITGLDFRSAVRRVERVVGKSDDWKPREKSISEMVMESASPLTRSAYLASRMIEQIPAGLYGVHALPYYEDGAVVGKYDAIIAPLRSADGKLVTVQATYLKDGRKAPVSVPKKTLPGPYKSINGAAVRLGRWESGPLGFAEGIESAMSASILYGIPVWACLSTSGMRSVQWPGNLTGAVIFADHDESYAGHAAAWELAHRMAIKGVKAQVMLPEKVGTDFNDVLKEIKNATAR